MGGPPAAPAKGARGFAKAKKGYIGFQKLLGSGGVWSIAKGRGRTVTAPPHWMWESLATFAPHCATLAVEGADLYSASKYFEVWALSSSFSFTSTPRLCARRRWNAGQLGLWHLSLRGKRSAVEDFSNGHL